MEVLRRYSNREDLLKPLVSVVERIQAEPLESADEPQLVSADGPSPHSRLLSARLTASDVEALAGSYLAGDTIRALTERYGISPSSVKRVLRERGVRKRGARGVPPASGAA